MDRLRWKFVASSWASHRQNSTAPNSDTRAGVGRSLVTRVRQTSSVSPGGTRYVVSARIPPRLAAMTVYPRPWRQA